MNLEETINTLRNIHRFDSTTFAFLDDKGFGEREYIKMLDIMQNIPRISFKEHIEKISPIDSQLYALSAREFTDGRYSKLVEEFNEISSEQALMRERLHVQVEHIIELTDFMSTLPEEVRPKLFRGKFTTTERETLRDIYRNFSIQDAAAIKLIDTKTKHDVVAANTWLVVKAQTLGLEGNYLRAITHFARTSADINTNAISILYTAAMSEWTSALQNLMSNIQGLGTNNLHTTMLAQTHGQYAQFTTFGYELGCILNSMSGHGREFFLEEKFMLEGKMDGATGTDVDMIASIGTAEDRAVVTNINTDPRTFYKKLIEGFGLAYSPIGNNQDTSNVEFIRMLNAMDNVGVIVQKLANDWWHYASRGLLQKRSEKGESGSSAMPQKQNPFDAESAEVLESMFSGYLTPLKHALAAYRTQGDLRRSMAMREAFHPIMLSIIAMKRLSDEIKKYTPNPIAMELEIYRDNNGLRVASSAIQSRLKAIGVEDAYDRIKELTMISSVNRLEIEEYLDSLTIREKNKITTDECNRLKEMIAASIDSRNLLSIIRSEDPYTAREGVTQVIETNKDTTRRRYLLGNAMKDGIQLLTDAVAKINRLSIYKK